MRLCSLVGELLEIQCKLSTRKKSFIPLHHQMEWLLIDAAHGCGTLDLVSVINGVIKTPKYMGRRVYKTLQNVLSKFM